MRAAGEPYEGALTLYFGSLADWSLGVCLRCLPSAGRAGGGASLCGPVRAVYAASSASLRAFSAALWSS